MIDFTAISTAARRRLGITIVCAAAAAVLAFAPGANAGNYPSHRVLPSVCHPWSTGSKMATEFTFLAADRYPSWNGENQWLYVRAALYSFGQGRIISTSPWMYGLAFDTMTPAVWYDYETDAYLGYHARPTFIVFLAARIGSGFNFDRPLALERQPDTALEQLLRILPRSRHDSGESPLPRTASWLKGPRETRSGSRLPGLWF